VKKRIDDMKREIERRGGLVVGLGDIPDDIAELFLEEVLACPHCAETTRPQGESIDKMLAGSARTDGRTH
jgi:hypothetical protein